jgi:hypothetical protein
VFEEPFLALDASTISDEFSIGSDDSVTGNNDDDGVFIVGSTDRSYGFRISSEDCLFFVTSGFSIRDFFEGFPGLFLEFCSFWGKWDRECFSLSRKVLFKLLFYFFIDGIFSLNVSNIICRISKTKFDQVGITRSSDEFSERG